MLTGWISLRNSSKNDVFILTTSIDWDVAEMYVLNEKNEVQTSIAGTNSKRPDYGFEHYNYFDIAFYKQKNLDIYFRLKFYSTNPGKIEVQIINKRNI
ncbi:MAG: hypothetical protein MZV63_37970 [Marinilabiliales bacterium]|nr:hypothetical protein [Marinilabiliales bacterium]